MYDENEIDEVDPVGAHEPVDGGRGGAAAYDPDDVAEFVAHDLRAMAAMFGEGSGVVAIGHVGGGRYLAAGDIGAVDDEFLGGWQ